MTDQNIGNNEVTDTSTDNNQATEKTFTQAEVNQNFGALRGRFGI